MANETDTGLLGQRTTAEALVALAAKPFDPATLLTSRPEAVPYRTGPTAEAVPTFDPATLLGDAARRGPAMIGDGKPLVARIGGVEVVTIPLEHYAALLNPLTRDQGEAGSMVDNKGMMDILMSLHAGDVISPDTGLDDAALGERVAAWAGAQPQPWTIESVRNGTIVGTTDRGQHFTVTVVPKPALSPAEGAALDITPWPEAAPVEVAPTPEEATVDLGKPAGMPEEATIAIPSEPLDTRTTPPEPKSTRHGFRRREKTEHKGGPMDAKGEPDNREPDPNSLLPRSYATQLKESGA